MVSQNYGSKSLDERLLDEKMSSDFRQAKNASEKVSVNWGLII
jgi:hypothetical protein